MVRWHDNMDVQLPSNGRGTLPSKTSPSMPVSWRGRALAPSPLRGKIAGMRKISFGGIPNSRNVLFLQIFKHLSVLFGNLLNLNWILHQSLQTLNLLRNPAEPDIAMHRGLIKPPRPSPEPLRNQPVEPDMAVHQGLLEPSLEPSPKPCAKDSLNLLRNPVEPDTHLLQNLLLNPPEPCWTWLCTKASQTLLNLTWLCTKASTPSPEPSPLCTKASQTFSRTFSLEPSPEPHPIEADLALHQGFLEPSLEPSREPYWTWPGSAPKPPRTFSGAFSGTFGTFSGLCWARPGACTSAHRSSSGLKTELAYAVGGKMPTVSYSMSLGYSVWGQDHCRAIVGAVHTWLGHTGRATRDSALDLLLGRLFVHGLNTPTAEVGPQNA